MGANLFSRRFTVQSTDGWVKVSAESVVVDCEIRASQNNNVAIRQVGSGVQEADAAQLSNTLQRLSGVDLSEIEVSTPSATPLTVHVIACSRR